MRTGTIARKNDEAKKTSRIAVDGRARIDTSTVYKQGVVGKKRKEPTTDERKRGRIQLRTGKSQPSSHTARAKKRARAMEPKNGDNGKTGKELGKCGQGRCFQNGVQSRCPVNTDHERARNGALRGLCARVVWKEGGKRGGVGGSFLPDVFLFSIGVVLWLCG